MARIRTIKPDAWGGVNEAWPFGDCIYVVQEGESGPLKIGVAWHPARRLSTLQSGNHRQLHMRAVFEADRRDCQRIVKELLRRLPVLRGGWIAAPLAQVITAISGGAS
jgi:hypothetical protein